MGCTLMSRVVKSADGRDGLQRNLSKPDGLPRIIGVLPVGLGAANV